MGRYTGPKGKLSRREGENLFLKGARSFSEKNALQRKPFVPGQHGNQKEQDFQTMEYSLERSKRLKEHME
jgi:small subunit ribosomal protein S4